MKRCAVEDCTTRIFVFHPPDQRILLTKTTWWNRILHERPYNNGMPILMSYAPPRGSFHARMHAFICRYVDTRMHVHVHIRTRKTNMRVLFCILWFSMAICEAGWSSKWRKNAFCVSSFLWHASPIVVWLNFYTSRSWWINVDYSAKGHHSNGEHSTRKILSMLLVKLKLSEQTNIYGCIARRHVTCQNMFFARKLS